MAAASRNNTRRRPAPITTIKPDPRVWAEALKLAAGDKRRLVVNRDGSVTVVNTDR